MPPCRVDAERSSSYLRALKGLVKGKNFRRAPEDLASAFKDIEKDYETACHATAIPGFERKVWKYRCRCSDAGSGRRSGFRIICYLVAGPNGAVLYPILLYWKGDDSGLPIDDIIKAIKDLQELEFLSFDS